MEFKNEFKWLGYEEVKETKTYIEAFKYTVLGRKDIYDRIKINKKTLEVNKDSRFGKGNGGHRNLGYDEVMLVGMILKHLQSNESRDLDEDEDDFGDKAYICEECGYEFGESEVE